MGSATQAGLWHSGCDDYALKVYQPSGVRAHSSAKKMIIQMYKHALIDIIIEALPRAET
jgi:hypothetical protein